MEKPSDFWLCASGAQSAITLVWNLLEWFSQPQGSLVGLGCAGIQQSRKFVIFSCPYRSLLPVHLQCVCLYIHVFHSSRWLHLRCFSPVCAIRQSGKRQSCVSFPSQAQPPDPELAATSPPSTALSWGPLGNHTEHIGDFFDKLW